MIDIFRIINGTETVACCVADDNASIKTAIMGVNEVVIDITVDTVLDIAIGDHIRVDSIVYELNRDPEFNQKSEVEHQYSFTFEHPLYRLLDKLYIYKLNKKSSFTLTGRLSDFAELLIWNINQTDDNPNGVDIGWTVGTTVVTEYKTLVFGNILCRDVLTKLANDFGVEFYLNNKEINFVTHIENETGLVFAQGKGKGLYTVSQKNVDTDNAVTRVYAIGGTQNIPADHADADGHLVLPEIYIENFSEYGKIVERGVEFNEIYPTFVGAVTSASGENNCVIQCADIDFDIKTVAVGEEARINFLTGDLMGKAFSFQWNNEKKEITLIEQEDETASPDESGKKPTIPSVLKKAKSLDEFNFTGLQLPDAYVANAVERLRKAATDWLEFYCRKRIKFELSIDHRYLRGKRAVVPGDLVTIKVPEHNIDKVIRVTSVDKKIKTGELTCVVSNYLDEKWEKKIEGQISSMQNAVGGSGGGLRVDIIEKNDSRPAKDTNVFSSLRALDEISSNNKELLKKVLRKDQPDRTDFPLTMGGGGKFGNFTPGFLGSGGSIDENGDGEVRDLKVRGSLEVNEFRFNRIDVISGESWNTFAFGKFTSVDTEAQIATVDLVDGEMLTSHVNDINRGIFHNLTGGNSTDDGKDECGFKKVFGYTTSYFTPIELLPDGKSFRYSLKPGTTAHPCAEMKYAAYGNFTDKSRQASAYSTRTTEILLANVNTWQIDADRHYMFIKGLLDGITIGGVELHGYSTFQRNGYLIGTQIQFTPEQLEDMKGNDAYSVNLSTYEGVIVVDGAGNVIGTMQSQYNVVSGEQNVVSDDSNVVASRYKLSTRIQAFRGSKELRYNTVMDADIYVVQVHATGCEYNIVGGVLTITRIIDVANAYVSLEVNCEGMALFTKSYHITAVLDGNSVWATYFDGEEEPVVPVGDGDQDGWHRNLTSTSVWVSQKNTRLVSEGIWGPPVRLKGISGDSAFALNLTSDTDAIACDSNGNPLGSGVLASTKAMLYVGGMAIDSGVSFSMYGGGCTVKENSNATGIVEVTGINSENAKVEITALYKGSITVCVYSLTKIRGGADGSNAIIYQLLPSADVIKRNIKDSTTSLYPTTLSCGVTKADGLEVTRLKELPIGYSVRCGASEDALKGYTLDSLINAADYPNGAVFVLSNDKSVVIDRENIPVVSDGTNGTNGVNGADGVNGKDGVSIVFKGELPAAPSNPQNGWSYYNTTDKKSYVFQSGAWYQMSVDGVNGANGKDGDDGLSVDYKGEMANPPGDPQKNWAYRDTDNGRVYIYNGVAWVLMVADGNNGTNGANGTNGMGVFITYYDGEDSPETPTGNGTTGGWHTAPNANCIWMSQKVSVDASSGSWGTPIRIKGTIGPQGVPGTPGVDGKVLYTWIRYADSENGAGISNYPSGKLYIGLAYNKESATESNTPTDYTWSLIKGTDGKNGTDGVPGAPGENGKTTYTWLAYSDNANGSGMYQIPNNGTRYIGIGVNKDTPTESNNPSDYTWSLFKGADGAPGASGGQYVTMYKYATEKPTDNPGVYLYTTDAENLAHDDMARGWTFAVPQKPVMGFNVQKYNKEDVNWGVSNGVYTAPSGLNGVNSRMKLSFVTVAPAQTVYIWADTSSEAGCDFGYILKPDTDGIPGADNTAYFASGTGANYRTVKLTIPNAGNHFIICGYKKDGSGSSGSDQFKFRITYPEYLWSTTAFCLRSAGVMWEAQGTVMWSSPTLYSSSGMGCVLESSVSQIVYNSIGSLTPSSFVVTAKEDKGGTPTSRFYLTCWKSTNGIDWVRDNTVANASSIQVVPSASYIMYKVRATSGYPNEYNVVYLSEAQINIVKDGSNEAAGSMPRNCGEFVSGRSYKWDKDFRDITYLREGSTSTIWMVNVFGRSVTSRPSINNSEWVQGNKETFTAIDTALIEGANIAEFLFKGGKMVSQDTNAQGEPNVSLNGKSGEVFMNTATVRGVLSSPFEVYDSVESFRVGKSLSWYITITAWAAINGKLINLFNKKFNGAEFRMFNASGYSLSFMMNTSRGVVNIALPDGKMLTAIGVPQVSNMADMCMHITNQLSYESSNNTYTVL